MAKKTLSSYLQLVVDTNAVTSGDNVGGLLSFPAMRDGDGYILESVVLADQAKLSSDMDLILFDSLPAGTFTTNVAQTLTDATLKLITAVIPLDTHAVFANNSVSFSANNLDIPIDAIPAVSGDKVIYGILVARSTPTQAATTDISIRLALREA